MARTASSRKRCVCISVSVIAAIIVIIAIVVPLAVILPKRKHAKPVTILFPLYIYPKTNTTWDPLYAAVEARAHQNFTVIVNPGSGPGSSQFPDSQYTTEIKKLNAYPNVNTVGYVRTGYGSRNISDVVSEVNTYAGWSSNSSDLAMHGIFFDEAPHEYSAAAVDFMKVANEAVKNATGLQRARTIIHNPGTIPDARYNDVNTDITVIFEESYTAYLSAETKLAALPQNRTAYSVMVHSVPTMTTSNLQKFVNKLADTAEFLFITDNSQSFYESFGSQWANFSSVVPT